MAASRSQSIAACLLCATLEDHPGSRLTYETSNVSLGQLMEWLRGRLGVSVQGQQQHVSINPVIDMETRTASVGGVNWTIDFLYRGVLEKPDERNEPRQMGAYAFATFYKKTSVKEFKSTVNRHYPRADFMSGHPQSNQCLMRNDPPRVPVLYGRIPRMPADWKDDPDEPEDAADDKASEKSKSGENDEDGRLNWALYVLALFYPITIDQPVDLSQFGDDLYEQVKTWWRSTYTIGDTKNASFPQLRPAYCTNSNLTFFFRPSVSN